jgi:tRNA nucleotidyltransferase (CCA-adding enzyme)
MIVSPYLGKQFTKDIFGKIFLFVDQTDAKKSHFMKGTPKKCRQTMPTYAYLVDSGKAKPLRFNTPLVVQDPFELNKNLTKSLSSEGLSMFKKMCRAAKDDFPTSKLYRLWNLKNIPKKLNQLVEEKNKVFKIDFDF